MSEINQAKQPTGAEAERRSRRPRRLVWTIAPAAVAATAAVVAIALVAAGALPWRAGGEGKRGPGPSTVAVGSVDKGGAAPLLLRISLAAEKKPLAPVRDDQFVYIESKDSFMVMSVSASGGASTVRMQPLHRRQVWLSVDGSRPGWLIEAAEPNDPRDGMTLDGNTHPSLNAPTYRYLESLPTDPDALLKKIYAETKGAGNSPDQEAFTTIGDLLRESIVPPKLSAALYRAAAKIPNVVLVKDSVDAVGRHGVAIAHVDDVNGSRDEWIFDKDSLEFLGERSVQVRSNDAIKAGMVTGKSAVLTRAVVDRIKQIP